MNDATQNETAAPAKSMEENFSEAIKGGILGLSASLVRTLALIRHAQSQGLAVQLALLFHPDGRILTHEPTVFKPEERPEAFEVEAPQASGTAKEEGIGGTDSAS